MNNNDKPAEDLKPSRRNKSAVNNLLNVLHISTLRSDSKIKDLTLEATGEAKTHNLKHTQRQWKSIKKLSSL